MKKNNAPGNDGITAEHLQLFYDQIEHVIPDIFNSCL